MVGDICIRCTEDLIEDDPSYDAEMYTLELSDEGVKHQLEDQVCINCANQYDGARYAKKLAQTSTKSD